MNRDVIVIGAGMGGLAAALRLAQRGFQVCVLEARSMAGGLAAGFHCEGLTFDAGPYVLLDRPGLEWAFRTLGLDLVERVELRRVDPVYEVMSGDGATVCFHASLEETAAGFERRWRGSGRRYRRFIEEIAAIYTTLSPLLFMSRPGLRDLVSHGAWRHLLFLLRSLQGVLAHSGLPGPVIDAIAIWTHVAAQSVEQAPSPMACVAALIHRVGAYYPVGGVGAIPRTLAAAATAAGIEISYGVKVRRIRRDGNRVCGVETEQREFLPADAIVCNAGGVGAYLELAEGTPASARAKLQRLPLQSPGVCAYLATQGPGSGPYLRFLLPGGKEKCRLFVQPGALDASLGHQGAWPARLLGPMDHAEAQRIGPAGQHAYLERLLAEPWWQEHAGPFRVVATRISVDWGAQYHLYRDSMNPVMTARFMRAGRLAHRSPYLRGLYLAGSATHPGQWVSFCAISGILAADRLCEDRD